ncbi:hypothetical protein GWI33_017569 [Rhynchophorus ferrugineus]|uniref:Uncharacterized protein n=1 Tax=Rhynchophorus ferrugineus TaxID=354439 RepID=A0A834HXX2_RHYFE|nr:hypothetical protein GWI33_017569 [Rhynchophorus ferrugineus]
MLLCNPKPGGCNFQFTSELLRVGPSPCPLSVPIRTTLKLNFQRCGWGEGRRSRGCASILPPATSEPAPPPPPLDENHNSSFFIVPGIVPQILLNNACRKPAKGSPADVIECAM